ncbi:bacteriophage Gp15 family protein [Caproiciproducens faecalis]|uniref:Bacteriophage Gp15 family protein n=1 Tax=Caproiciproducens faecalis TaxID=2820301 RepID=A0ABS7DRK4_9FIRM|nr:bacteriophage Gp15 family protein [Caproiciproducens faecalis]MBW7573918.1 bacteriophage Gp15 family protein [Caproiciproducens faecalis]
MNVLIDGLPTRAEIDGAEYEINTGYRVGLQIMTAFEDPDLTGFEKQCVMLELLYPVIPPDRAKAAEIAVKFLNCGEESTDGSFTGVTDSERYYSFTQDARYIMSAVEQTYHIDLSQVEYLHWWKFSYMFLDLNEDCFFCKLIYLRKQKAKGKLTKEEQEWYRSIRHIVDLPEVYTADEQSAINDFMAQLGQ